MEMTVEYTRENDVHTLSAEGVALPRIVVDNTGLPPEKRGGTAKQLLGSAAVFCYMSALLGSLEARGAKPLSARASATLEVGPNDAGQGRVKKIAIHAQISLSEDNEAVFHRVERIMRQGCLVTGSLHDGIEMEYDLKADFV